MIQSPGLLLTIVAFLGVIGPLVFIHEQGHYWAGRLFGVKIDAFSIGFGRELAGWTDKRGTRWKLGWLPLGGYVRFAGDMGVTGEPSADWLALPAAERNRTLQAKPVWQRAIVVAAGPAVNFLAALLILAAFPLIYGDLRLPPTIGKLQPGGAAAAAGLRPGDRITAVDGAAIGRFDQIAPLIALRGGERLPVTFDRGGRHLGTEVTIKAEVEQDGFGNREPIGRLGIYPASAERVNVGPVEALAIAARIVGANVTLTATALARVVTGRTPVSLLHGPVGTARMAGEQLTIGWAAFVWLVAAISINLGFINLLPVPMLDGGHLFFYAIEAIRRRPVGAAAQEWAYRGGLVAILCLMLTTTFNDVAATGLWQRLVGLIG